MPDCNVPNPPVAKADFCAPVINFGQVSKLYAGVAGNPMLDWSDLLEWNARIDNDTLADPTKIRYFHVIGDKPGAERTEIPFSQNRKAYTTPKHTVNVRIDETGDENYAYLKFIEENPGMTVPVWYEVGGNLYGGNDGVQATINLVEVVPESDEELVYFQGTISWEDASPERIVNPMA